MIFQVANGFIFAFDPRFGESMLIPVGGGLRKDVQSKILNS